MSEPPPISGSMPAPPQLTPQNLREISEAKVGMKKINRAASVAWTDGWTLAVFAGLTLLVCLPQLDWVGTLLGLGMCGAAYLEFRGALRLKRLEAGVTRMLAYNQLGLGALLFIYAAWSLYSDPMAANDLTRQIALDPGQMKQVEDLSRLAYFALYGGMMAISIFGQGGMALYYFTRRRYVEKYVAQTPEWILAMQRAGVTI